MEMDRAISFSLGEDNKKGFDGTCLTSAKSKTLAVKQQTLLCQKGY